MAKSSGISTFFHSLAYCIIWIYNLFPLVFFSVFSTVIRLMSFWVPPAVPETVKWNLYSVKKQNILLQQLPKSQKYALLHIHSWQAPAKIFGSAALSPTGCQELEAQDGVHPQTTCIVEWNVCSETKFPSCKDRTNCIRCFNAKTSQTDNICFSSALPEVRIVFICSWAVPQKVPLFLFFQNHLVNSNKFLPARDVAESVGGQHELVEAMYICICIKLCLQLIQEIVCVSQ